ncbi:substrate-binding periplasmic protein [Pseudomonas sp. Pseusp122]
MRLCTVHLLLGLFSVTVLADQPAAVIYLPEAMPLATSSNSARHGLFGDIALEALDKAGYRVTIKSDPVLRVTSRLREEENLLFTPFSRTPDREDHYTWVASVMPLPRAFFSFTEPVQDFEQARMLYKRIGVGVGTAQEEILLRHGFSPSQIYPLKLGDTPIKLLELGRIDAWFTVVPEGKYDWGRSNAKPLLISPEMAITDMFLVCSKRCDTTLVEALRHAMDALRADGSIARIQARYLSEPQ